MKAWPGKWRVEESLDGGQPDCPTTGVIVWIVAEGGSVARVFPCDNPARAFGDPSLTDHGAVPGIEGYEIGLAIARATAKEIVDSHNAMIDGKLNF